MPRMGLTPDKVVAAAATIADAHGLDEASLSNIAAVLGVRVPSLYKHVDGLEDLHRRLAALGFETLLASLEHSVIGKSGRDSLLAFCAAHRRFSAAHGGQFAAMLRNEVPAEQRQEFDNAIDGILRAVMEDYGVRGAEANHAVRAARSSLVGFASLEAVGSFEDEDDAEASFYSMVALLDRGLATPAAAPRRGGFRLPGLPTIPGLPAIGIPGR